MEFALKVSDPDTAAGAIEKAVVRLGGRINGRAYSEGSHLLYVQVDAQQVRELGERLGRVGKVRERPPAPDGTEGMVELTIRW